MMTMLGLQAHKIERWLADLEQRVGTLEAAAQAPSAKTTKARPSPLVPLGALLYG